MTERKCLVFNFANIEVREREFLLIRGGERQPVEPTAFRVLLFMLHNPGRIVSKEEIVAAVWSDVAVSDNSLTRAIAQLRRVLDDDPREPRYILTVPTLGYRFLSEVNAREDGIGKGLRPIQPNAIEPRSTQRYGGKKRLVLFGTLAVITLSLILAGERFNNGRRTVSGGTPSHYRVVPVTNLSGAVADPAISSDGKQVAFFWDPAGRDLGDWAGLSQEKSGLYVQLVGGGQPLRLTEPKPGFVGHAAWSPDGREIAFGRCTEDGGAIYTISPLGGAEHKVTDLICLFGETGYVNWTPDSKSMVLVDRCGPGLALGIVLLSLETGQKQCLTTPPPGALTDLGLVVSPDGKTVAFVRMSTSGIGDIYTVPLAGGQARRLTHENKGVWQLMWSADGQSIIFLSNQTGIDGLRRIRADGGGTIELETEYPGVGSLAKDGSRLVYVQPQGFWANSASIWRADLASAGGRVEHTQQLTSSHASSAGAQISPDGKFVVFESARSGAPEIWKCNADGGDPLQLTSFGGHAGTPRWSPDGKWIAFDYRPQEHSQIWLMDPDGRNAHAVVIGAYDNVVPSWTRDGNTILFASNHTGQYQVWAHDLSNGHESQITAKGGFASFEAPNAKSLFYTKFDSAGIWIVPRNGGPETRLISEPRLGYWGHFAVTDEGIYFLDSDASNGPTIEYYAFKTKVVGKVLSFEKDQSAVPWTASISASLDGHMIYFNQGTTKSSIVMAEFTP